MLSYAYGYCYLHQCMGAWLSITLRIWAGLFSLMYRGMNSLVNIFCLDSRAHDFFVTVNWHGNLCKRKGGGLSWLIYEGGIVFVHV